MNLYRIRWAVRLTLALGVAASICANVLHAEPNPISQAIASWPPLALLMTIELVSRVPVHRKSLVAMRVVATAVISGIACYVSYWHMVGVAQRYGETDTSAYLLPISVDGLIVVASICLVELDAKIREQESTPTAELVSITAQNVYQPENPPADITGKIPAFSLGRASHGPIGSTPVESSHQHQTAASLPADDQVTSPPAAAYIPDAVEPALSDTRLTSSPKPRLHVATDELKAKAIDYIRTYTGERTLTGKAVGDQFGKSDRWGRDRLVEARSEA